MSKISCGSLVGKRVRILEENTIRYGTVIDSLSKTETVECMMFGHLIKARMDDTGLEEEFLYGWEIEE